MGKKNFNWGAGLFIIGYHLLLLIGLPIYLYNNTPSTTLVTLSLALVFVTGVCVTSLYHRKYSHPTYKINKWIEAPILFLATAATQGSALRWGYDHREHHAYVDSDRDPYSINKGFWYAHFLWLFEKPREIQNRVVSDLLKNKMIVFQHRFYGLLMVVTNVMITLFFGWLLNDYLGAFFFIWLVRLFLLHHLTWFINSLAHYWGTQRFSREHSACDNYALCLLTFGEGYHNYHHTFANDYRNGIRWYHFDPTKWFIWTLSKLGLAHDLRTADEFRVKELIIKDSCGEIFEALKKSFHDQKETVEKKVHLLSESLLEKLSLLNKQTQQYYAYKKEKIHDHDLLNKLDLEIKILKKSSKEEWKEFRSFYRSLVKEKYPARTQ